MQHGCDTNIRFFVPVKRKATGTEAGANWRTSASSVVLQVYRLLDLQPIVRNLPEHKRKAPARAQLAHLASSGCSRPVPWARSNNSATVAGSMRPAAGSKCGVYGPAYGLGAGQLDDREEIGLADQGP